MVSALIRNEALDNSAPPNMLPYQQNCVAMALSRVLGIALHPTVNLCIAKGWVQNGNGMQYDAAIGRIVAGLPLAQILLDEPWLTAKPQLSNLADGRYFAVNTGVHQFGGQGVGHAFVIIKKGGWSIYANNSEINGHGQSYRSRINDAHNISIWGPA